MGRLGSDAAIVIWELFTKFLWVRTAGAPDPPLPGIYIFHWGPHIKKRLWARIRLDFSRTNSGFCLRTQSSVRVKGWSYPRNYVTFVRLWSSGWYCDRGTSWLNLDPLRSENPTDMVKWFRQKVLKCKIWQRQNSIVSQSSKNLWRVRGAGRPGFLEKSLQT